jgi:hypothetical protein
MHRWSCWLQGRNQSCISAAIASRTAIRGSICTVPSSLSAPLFARLQHFSIELCARAAIRAAHERPSVVRQQHQCIFQLQGSNKSSISASAAIASRTAIRGFVRALPSAPSALLFAQLQHFLIC